MDEFEIIADIFAPLAQEPGAFGLKDDAAAISARPGFDLIVTTDQIAEGTDFFAFDSAASVAKKALRVNLSDLAAKGAVPEFVTEASGKGKAESFTVIYKGKGEVEHGVVMLRTEQDARALARVPANDAATLAHLLNMDRTPVGSQGEIVSTGDGVLEWRHS